MRSKYRSGHCGITLVREEGEHYKRVTFGEWSHKHCTGSYLGTECSCACHHGGSPWDEIGTLISKGRRVAPMLGAGPRSAPKTQKRKKAVDIRQEMQEMIDSIDFGQENDNG